MASGRFSISNKNKRAISFVWTGTLLGAVLGFGTQILLARGLGTEAFGAFSSALNLIGFIAPLAGFGVSNYWFKCFGEEGWSGVRWVKPSFRFVIFTTAIVILSVNLWAWLGPNDRLSQNILHFFSFTVLSTLVVELASAKYQLEERFALFSWVRLLPVLLRFLVVAFGVLITSSLWGVEQLAKAYWCIAICISLLITPSLIKMWSGEILLKGHDSLEEPIKQNETIQASAVLNETWVFGVAGVLYLVWGQGHVVLAKYTLGDHSAGIYSSALVLINAICLLPSVGYSKFLLPKIHRWANHDVEKLKKVFQAGNIIMFCLGGAGLIVAIVLSLWGINLIFGDQYAQAEIVILILGVTLPIRFLGYSVGSLLVTKHYMKQKVKVMFFVAVLNVGLALLLMPYWGLHGLAITVVVCEAVLIASYWRLVNRCYGNTWS